MAYNDKNYGNRVGFNPRDSRPEPKVLTFPAGYLKDAYLDETGDRDIRYITSFAEAIGKSFSTDDKTGKSKIRSYFDTVNSIKDALFNKVISENTAMFQLAQLKSRVVNRVAKETASPFFSDFINKNIDIVVSDKALFKERLLHFRDHFEAVVCYTAEKKDRR